MDEKTGALGIGGVVVMMIVSGALAVPAMFEAETETRNVPARLGTPEISPVAVFMLRPGGSPVA